MINKGKLTILFFGDNWDNRWRRRQQLAWGLAKRDMVAQVVYVEQPLAIPSFFKFLIGKADFDGMNRWRRVLHNRSWLTHEGDKLSILTPFAPLPPIGIEPLFKASERYRDTWLLGHIRKYFKLDRPVVWISHPQISIETIKALDPGLLWYDCTEDFKAWPGMPACVLKQVKETDSYMTKHANVITAVSQILYKEKKQVNPNTFWLPNAVDTDLFLRPVSDYPIPEELRAVSRPVLAFVGGMSEWAHDWELLDKLATLRPMWTFLLVGGLSVSRRTRKMLSSHKNIICTGQLPYSDLPRFLIHSDLCFLFYRPIRKNNSGNSQKLFLYLAAGKPIVSTRSADVESYSDHVCIVDDPKEFIFSAENALAGDTPESVRLRQAVAFQNSWDNRVKQILSLFGSLI